MNTTRYRLAPDVPDLAALGAQRVEDLLGLGLPLEGADRALMVASWAGAELWRLPLPGTPDEQGRARGRPRGAGTGWVYLRRYLRPSLRERLDARLSAPRSESLGQREWNLFCHLRAEGVGTPEPLAVGEQAQALVAARSFLVTRALEDSLAAPRWFERSARDRALRRRGLLALGLALRRLFAARVELPRMRLAHWHLSLGDPSAALSEPEACSLEKIIQARGAQRGARPELEAEGGTELSWRRLPDALLTSVRGGRLAPRVRARRLVRMLRALDDEARALGLEARDLWRVALRAAPRETHWGRALRAGWRRSAGTGSGSR